MSFSSVIVEYSRFIKSLRESFALAVDEDDYKHGAFRGLITAATPPLQAIDLFLASEKVTEHEKANSFRPLREILAQLHGADLSKMSMMKFLGDVMPAMEFLSVFMDWRKARGMYVPGTMVQVLEKNDKVIETQMIANDGTVTTTQGGVDGQSRDTDDVATKTEIELVQVDNVKHDLDDFGAAFKENLRVRGFE